MVKQYALLNEQYVFSLSVNTLEHLHHTFWLMQKTYFW